MEEFYTKKVINNKVCKVLMVGQPIEFNFQDENIIKAHIYKENDMWYVVDDETGTSINREFDTRKNAIISVEAILDIIVNIMKKDFYQQSVKEFNEMEITGKLMLKDEIKKVIGGRPFQLENGDSLFVDYDNDKNILYAGTATNSGIFRDFTIKYNKDVSKDKPQNK